IALPWLVLQLTGSALALGTVLALASIPRALFMLVGGAFVDRYSPRSVMFASNFARLVLVAVMSALVLTNTMRIEMLYAFALAFGLADAFYFPAQTAIVPQILPYEQLQAGNSFVQGTAQLSLLLGPALAGALIALLGHAATGAPGMQGIGLAFGVDTLSFVASLHTLLMMSVPGVAKQAAGQQNVIASIKEGFDYVWSRPVLRVFFLLIVATNFLVLGPVTVGIPVLADKRLVEGAAAFGIILSAFGAGAFPGIILSNILPAPKPEHFGIVIVFGGAILGIGVALMPLFPSTAVVAIIAFLIGVVTGYQKMLLFTWLQKRIPRELMGRVMSLLFFCSIGLAPVSNALAGAILQVNLNLLFIGGGVLMTALTLLSILLPETRQMGLETKVSAN
ncbi:MAG TPA: MFS transporter, partial [Aggregatilineales bacterium]|nr:MFS transporter [Aggregatilineales bacterium]